MVPAKVNLRQSLWLLFLPMLWWGSSAASGWLNPIFQPTDFGFLEFAVHAGRAADYGVDSFTMSLAPIDPSIIDEALTDQGTSAPETLGPSSGDTSPNNGKNDEDASSSDDQEGSDNDANPTDPAPPQPTPQPTTDPGSNGNGNSGGNGNGNDGENGNSGGNGNGNDGDGNGNSGGNGNGKGNGKDETGLNPLLNDLLASL
jgi:hypothetical protein